MICFFSLKSFKECFLSFIAAYIQRQLRVSLRRRCRNALSTDWLTQDKAKSFPLRDYYVGLKQKKKIKRAMRDTSEELERIHDVLNVGVEGAVNVAVIGLYQECVSFSSKVETFCTKFNSRVRHYIYLHTRNFPLSMVCRFSQTSFWID